jgi:hypothetical protein
MGREFWLGVIITLIVGIPGAYLIGILANLHTPRLIEFLDRRKLLKTHKTKKQALRVFNRIKNFRSGKRDRYPFYIIVSAAGVVSGVAASSIVVIAVLMPDLWWESRTVLFLFAVLVAILSFICFAGIYETARQIERFDDYEAEFKKKWGDP